MKYLRLAALYWGVRGLESEDYSKLIDATIEGTSEWLKQEENKKSLKELGLFCASRFFKHLKPVKKDEKADSNIPDAPCA